MASPWATWCAWLSLAGLVVQTAMIGVSLPRREGDEILGTLFSLCLIPVSFIVFLILRRYAASLSRLRRGDVAAFDLAVRDQRALFRFMVLGVVIMVCLFTAAAAVGGFVAAVKEAR